MKVPSKKIFQIVMSVALMAALFYLIDLKQLKNSIANANVLYLCIALVMILFNRVLMPVKWNLLLRAKGITVSWLDAIRIYSMSAFAGLFLPPTVGCDTVRVVYFRQRKYPVSDILSSKQDRLNRFFRRLWQQAATTSPPKIWQAMPCSVVS